MYKIALLGRPNVGKSTLFNRLIRSNRAITHDRAGITRDRMEGIVRNRFHRPFTIIDTGGITLDSHASVAEGPAGLRGFETEILAQAKEAIEEACGICLVVDGRDGLMPFDEHLAHYLRRLGKPVLLVVNKVDGMEREDIMCADFHILGFPIVAVSAEHGNQIRFFESLMVDMLPEVPDFDEEEVMSGILLEEDNEEINAKKNKKAHNKRRKNAADSDELLQAEAYIKEGLIAQEKAQAESTNTVSYDDVININQNMADLEETDFVDFENDEAESEDYLVDFDEGFLNAENIFTEEEERRAEEISTEENTQESIAVGVEKTNLTPPKAQSIQGLNGAPIDIEKPMLAKPQKKKGPLKICLLGRPNAGKSSILNAFVGKERMIVSELAGTTRDSVDVPLEWQGNTYIFVDTAGIRRRTKISDTVERFSVNSSLKSTSKADVTFLVIDALQGLTAQDKRLIELLDERKTPFLIILNKMDLVPASARKSLQKQFTETLAFCHHVPIMQTSAKNRYGLKMLLPMAEQIKAECFVRVGTGQLNRAMDAVLTKHQPPVVRRVRPKFYYLTQAENEPPTFVFFVNDAERVGDSYQRYLEKALRRLFAIEHAPMRVHLRSSHTKNSEKRQGKKKKNEEILEKPVSQYIDQKPQKVQKDALGKDSQKSEIPKGQETEHVESKKKGKATSKSAGKAKATQKDRTTLKAALRNPSSVQSRSLKKSMRKKKD